MTINWKHFINNFLISKFLFILVILSGALISFNGLIYSDLNTTLHGVVLLLIGLTLYLLFNPNPLKNALLITPKNKRNK